MIDIALWVQTLATSAMVAYTPKLSETFAKQGAEATAIALKQGIEQIQKWALHSFGASASITKSLDKVIAKPEERNAQERLVQDLKEDASEETLRSLEPLIQTLCQHIQSEIGKQILIQAEIVIQAPVSGGYFAAGDMHIHQALDVKKNN